MLLDFKLWKDEKLIINESKCTYEKEGDIITFTLEGITNTIDLKNKIFERYNEEFHFYLNFANEKCTYELKSHHAIFDILVEQAFFEIKNNELEIIYAIETDDEKNKIIIKF